MAWRTTRTWRVWARRRLASAWFQKSGSTWRVKVHTRGVILQPKGDMPPEQSFDLGTGDDGRGLAIAATKDMVYVAWFQGTRSSSGASASDRARHYHLSSLGTATVATLPARRAAWSSARRVHAWSSPTRRTPTSGYARSTNEGASFGSPKTLVNNESGGFASAWPTTVAVKGTRMVVGAAEVVGDIGFSGAGFGFLSTDGGSHWNDRPSHSGGVLVAGLVKVGSSYRYAEAWDRSLHDESDDPSVERLRFRRAVTA